MGGTESADIRVQRAADEAWQIALDALEKCERTKAMTLTKGVAPQERQNEERRASALVRTHLAIVDDTKPQDVTKLRQTWHQILIIAQSMERY